MGFRIGAYAKVWEIRQGSGNYIDAKISTSHKDKNTGEYVTDFNAWVRFVGGACRKGQEITDGARIKIGECEVKNKYDKEKGVTYTNYAMFDFETVDGGVKNSNGDKGIFIPIDDDEVPF